VIESGYKGWEKPVIEFKAHDLEIDFTPKTEGTEIKGYVMDRKNIIVKEGKTDDKVKD